MSGFQPNTRPSGAFERAATALRDLDLTSEPAQDVRTDVLGVIESYLMPRSVDPASPLNVVFVGPTGSGKSTLINSVMGRSLSPAGFLRPTTAEPLVCLGTNNELTISLTDSEIVRGGAPILEDVTLVDTPDIDSTVSENRRRAFEAIAGADIVVLVASASRYSDLEPWTLLRRLRERRTPVIHVVNRVTPGSAGAVTDYRRRLRREAVAGVVVRVAEHQDTPGDMLPAASIRRLRRAILDEVRAIDPTQRYIETIDHSIQLAGELREHVRAERERLEIFESPVNEVSLLPNSADLVNAWTESLRRINSSLWLGRLGSFAVGQARGPAILRLVESVERDLTIAVEGQLIRLLTASGVAAEVLSKARALVDETITDWLEGVDPIGKFEQLSARRQLRKLTSVVGAVDEFNQQPTRDWKLSVSLETLRADLVRLVSDSRAADIVSVEEAISELRRKRPLAAAVNG